MEQRFKSYHLHINEGIVLGRSCFSLHAQRRIRYNGAVHSSPVFVILPCKWKCWTTTLNTTLMTIYIQTNHCWCVHCRRKKGKDKGMFLYIAQYPVCWTGQGTLHLTLWKTCSFRHQLDIEKDCGGKEGVLYCYNLAIEHQILNCRDKIVFTGQFCSFHVASV